MIKLTEMDKFLNIFNLIQYYSVKFDENVT